MKCEFCREEIADDALVCPHCRKATSSGRSAGRGNALKWVLILFVGVPVGGLALLLLIGSMLPNESPSERAKKACEAHYTTDLERLQCENAIMLKALDQQEADKLHSAEREAGITH